jgi:hypothetical protein
MKKKEDTFIEDLRKVFVSIDVFNLRISPLEQLVYGVVAMILITFAGLVIKFFIK